MTHGFGCYAEKVLAVNRARGSLTESKVGLVDHGRRMQGCLAVKSGKLVVRKSMQLTVQQLYGAVIGVDITIAMSIDQSGYVGASIQLENIPRLFDANTISQLRASSGLLPGIVAVDRQFPRMTLRSALSRGIVQSLKVETRTSGIALASSLIVLVCSACSDTRTPYEADVDCDADIKRANSLTGRISCLTDNQQQMLRARSQDDDACWTQFQDTRPVIKRLHEDRWNTGVGTAGGYKHRAI
jgi:hypothetical protein